MTEPRPAAVVVLLLLLGWAMIGLASTVDAWWPLFLAAVPYAAVPWVIVRSERASG